MKMHENVGVETEQGGETVPFGQCILSLRAGGERISLVLKTTEIEALIEALTPFASHKHRWVTDEDGVVHPCACGASYAPRPPLSLPKYSPPTTPTAEKHEHVWVAYLSTLMKCACGVCAIEPGAAESPPGPDWRPWAKDGGR